MTPLPRPSEDPVQIPFWEAAKRGELAFQRCRGCNAAFLPGRLECPGCLSNELGWEQASGKAKLISWIVYHRAYNAAFANRLPYNVAIVELDEGVRMISNITGVADAETLRADQPLILSIEEDDGLSVPRFAPAP